VIVPAAQAATTLAPQSHSLMPLLFGQRHLRRAARQCMRRCSSPGADRMTWHGYRQGFDQRITLLAEQLRQGTWRPGPIRQVAVPTFASKVLMVAIPTVEDRIVHRAMRNCIEPVLEARAFREFVSGYRPRRNRITAVAQAARYYADSYGWVADIDVADVSGSASVEEVIGWLACWITDGTFLARVRTALVDLPSPIVPGTGLAPLLINLRLVPVDEALAHRRVVRFCDNYCVFTATDREAASAFTEAEDALAQIGLRPAPGKSRIHGHMNPEDLFMIAG
jgi:RNA-directed DNA polymerase